MVMPTKPPSKVKVLTQLSLMDLRGILAEQIDRIRTGDATAATVNAISNATGKYLSTIKIELEYHKLLGKTPHMPGLLSESSTDAPSATEPIPFKKSEPGGA